MLMYYNELPLKILRAKSLRKYLTFSVPFLPTINIQVVNSKGHFLNAPKIALIK
jgi:hypothetical protein